MSVKDSNGTGEAIKWTLTIILCMAITVGEVFLFTALFNVPNTFVMVLSLFTVPIALFFIIALIKGAMEPATEPETEMETQDKEDDDAVECIEFTENEKNEDKEQ